MEIKRLGTNQRMSKAVIHGNTVYFCGQVAKDRTAGIKDQTKTTLEKIEELLSSVGSDKTKILSATIYLKDIGLFKEMNEVWDAWIEEGFAPARTCVEAKMASPELLIEITVTAAI